MPMVRHPRNEDTLPLWARELLEQNRKRIAHLEKELNALKDGTRESPFFLQEWNSEKRFYIASTSGRVRFDAGQGRVDLSFDSDTDLLRVSVDGRLMVVGQAANVILIGAYNPKRRSV